MVASASLSLWGTWRTEGLVYTNCGPRPPTTEPTPSLGPDDDAALGSTIPSEYNQCVFLRYYTIRRRGLIPKLIKAGAGPHDLGDYGFGDYSSGSAYPQDSQNEGNSDSDVVVHNVPSVRAAPIAITCSYSATVGRYGRF